MRTIPLTKGFEAIVDDEDFEEINHFKWFALANRQTVYARRNITTETGRKTELMHRRIIRLANPKIHCDHRDGNGLNNQRSNLRECTKLENHHNTRKHRDNTSGYKGVYWNKQGRKWVDRIMIDNKYKHIGCFTEPIEAAIAYNTAATKYHGEFAKLNIFNN